LATDIFQRKELCSHKQSRVEPHTHLYFHYTSTGDLASLDSIILWVAPLICWH